MESEKIPHAEFLDILFEGRNKDYGAYQLRKTYNGRLVKALASTGALCLLLIGGYTLAGKFDGASTHTLLINDSMTLAEVDKKPLEKPVQILSRSQPVQQATIRDLIPRIVPDPQVRPEDVPPTNQEVENARIGNTTVNGVSDSDIQGPPSAGGNGSGVVEAPPAHTNREDSIYIDVQIESTYPGGPQAWMRFLLKNFHTPEQVAAEGIGGKVMVQFIVDKEGNVSNVQAISGPEALQAEAVRVIKKSGKWEAAIHNGRKVNSYKKQPIIVELQDQ